MFFPFHLIGLLLNYLPYKIPVLFVNKNVKDKHFSWLFKNGNGSCAVFYILGYRNDNLLYNFWMEIWHTIFTYSSFYALFSFRYWILLTKVKGMYAYRKNHDKLHEIKIEYLKMYEVIK